MPRPGQHFTWAQEQSKLKGHRIYHRYESQAKIKVRVRDEDGSPSTWNYNNQKHSQKRD